jgi:6-phosphogluconolactonase (cycloisomerase 2 family)
MRKGDPMHLRSRVLQTTVASLLSAAALIASGAPSAGAHSFDQHAVFVQTDNLAGNQIVAYDRVADGTLRQAGIYGTGGLGGQLEGSVADHLASQGSLAFDAENDLLYAVNAGSNTISVFAVYGDRLALRQVLSSGGSYPVSIAVNDGRVYVLNALEGGSLQGFRVLFGHLVPIPGSKRALGLNLNAKPQFTNTPGQVAFSPDGSELLVTTKANGEDLDVFHVDWLGLLSHAPVVNPLPGSVPFALTFESENRIVLAEAAGFVATFDLSQDGTVTQLDSVPTSEEATCWITAVGGRFLFASNAGSASLSGFRSQAGGALLDPLGVTGTEAGTVDSASSPDGRDLYVQAGVPGAVDEFSVAGNGALAAIGSVIVPGAAGGEGIVAP